MSPILVRPVRERLEHVRIIRQLQAKFRRKYQLPFPLLADVDHAVATAYGAWGEKSMYSRRYMGVLRNTYVIGPDGRIKHVFQKVKPKGHPSEVLAALAD